jgi:hypothetical protein
LFYQCVSPDNNGECLAEYDHSTNNFERIKYLVPFFKEFDMHTDLNFPIEVLLDTIDLQRYIDDDEFIEDTLRAMPVMLQLALDHNMAEVTRMQEENLAGHRGYSQSNASHVAACP